MTSLRSIIFLPYILALFLAVGCIPAGGRGPSSEWRRYPDVSSDSQLVRIGLRVEAEKASVGCAGPLIVTGLASRTKAELKAGEYMMTVKEGSIVVGGKSFGKKIRLSSKRAADFVESNEKKFRGNLEVWVANSRTLIVINVLPVDAYLKGVLPREVVPTWPEESLKAQAVASRTYLVSHLGKHADEGFDLCSEVHCQVYGGVGREDVRTSQAVDATRGEILVYHKEPIGAYFHSNCGGQTEQVAAVWGMENKPYLPSRRCPYGKADPRYEWSRTLEVGEILSALRKETKVLGAIIKSIRVKKKSRSGRAEIVTVKTDRGSFDLSGNAFRMALGPEIIRSTLWTSLSKTRTGYRFRGRGWGHGVGMCQWGARGQAEAGRSYRQILKFYYPGTALTLWKR